MALDKLAFVPATGWADTTEFPTNPDTEAESRTMLQKLHTQTQTFLNDFIETLEATGADDIGFSAITGLTATKDRAAFVELLAKFGNYIASSTIEQTLSSSSTKIPSSAAVTAAMVTAGLGDMLSSVYVTTGGAGKVLAAVNADKLGNVAADDYETEAHAAATYATAVSVPDKVSDLTNDSAFQTASGGVSGWVGTDGVTYLLKGKCTMAQYEADSVNTDRARTVYLVPLD